MTRDDPLKAEIIKILRAHEEVKQILRRIKMARKMINALSTDMLTGQDKWALKQVGVTDKVQIEKNYGHLWE